MIRRRVRRVHHRRIRRALLFLTHINLQYLHVIF